MSNAVSVILLLVGLFWIDPAGAQRAPRDSPSWLLSVREGQLTANINRIPLHVVLEELARQVPLRLSVSETLREHSVTVNFRALPLDEALERLLAGLSYAILYAPALSVAGPAEKIQIAELIVLDKVPAPTVVGSSESADFTSMLRAMDTPPEWTAVLQHPDREVRLEALRRWAEQGAATPLNPLTHALVDPDESVRARAQELVERVLAAKAKAEAR